MKKRLLLTCSGGETSMFMVLWCWKNLQEHYNMIIVFANTGQEDNETLEFVHKCQVEFNLPIVWIETKVHHGIRKSSSYYIIDYNTATRNNDWIDTEDTPFEQVIKKYNLPNHSRLHCTRELKMNPIKAYAKKKWGNKKYYLALGIRMDEFDRINSKANDLRIIYPLINKDMQPMTKKHINFFWSQQPFRLNLKGYQGNCITCYKKSNNKLYQIAQENPKAFDFFNSMEQKYGNVNGKIPQKIWVDGLTTEGKIYGKIQVLETLPKEEYRNTIFRGFKTAKDIVEESKSFDKTIVDDHIETESCEIFSNCGDLE